MRLVTDIYSKMKLSDLEYADGVTLPNEGLGEVRIFPDTVIMFGMNFAPFECRILMED